MPQAETKPQVAAKTAAWQLALGVGPTGRLRTEAAAAHQAPRVAGGLAGILCGKRRRVVEAAAAQQPRVVGGAALILCGKRRMEVKEGQGLEQSLVAHGHARAQGFLSGEHACARPCRSWHAERGGRLVP